MGRYNHWVCYTWLSGEGGVRQWKVSLHGPQILVKSVVLILVLDMTLIKIYFEYFWP